MVTHLVVWSPSLGQHWNLKQLWSAGGTDYKVNEPTGQRTHLVTFNSDECDVHGMRNDDLGQMGFLSVISQIDVNV